MRKLLLFCFLSCCFFGCKEVTENYRWDPIEVSKEVLFFGENGGEATVYCLNYSKWWISQACPTAEIDGPGNNFVKPTDNGSILELGGLRAELAADNSVKITVLSATDINDWTLTMTVGNVFKNIRVYQNK